MNLLNNNYKNVLSLLISVRNQLLSSINSENDSLNTIFSILNEEPIASFDSSTSLDNGDAITFSHNGANGSNIITYIKSSGEKIVNEVADLDLSLDTDLNGEGYRLSSLLSYINDSEALNEVVYNANIAMLNGGSVAKSYILELIDDAQNSRTISGLRTLRQYILSFSEDTITPLNWTAIINALYTPVKDATEEGTLTLDATTVVVKDFIGTSILQLVGTILEFAGLILSKITTIVGIVLSLIGLAINWTLNLANDITSTAKVDLSANNYYLETPMLSYSQHVADNPSDPNYSSFSGICKINGDAQVISLPGFDIYTWERKTGDGNDITIFQNGFVNLNVKPDRAQDIMQAYCRDSQSSTESILTVNPYNLINDAGWNDGDNFMSITDILANSNNDSYIAKAAYLSLMLFIISCCGYNKGSGSQNIYEPYANANIQIATSDKDFASSHASYFDDNNSARGVKYFLVAGYQLMAFSPTYNWSNKWADIAACCKWLMLNLTSNTSATAYQLATHDYISSTDYVAILCGRTIDGLARIAQRNPVPTYMSLYELSNTPNKKFCSLPDYSNKAILNTLLIVGGVMVAGAITTAIGTQFIKQRIAYSKFKNLTRLNTLQAQAISSGSKKDWNKLYNATRLYNFKARLFGWGSYDMVNGWYNNDSMSATSDINDSAINQVSNSDLLHIISNKISPEG